VAVRFSHANIVARDPDALARFYTDVFECRRVIRRQWDNDWIGRGMGLPGARLDVIHVALPGLDDAGATIEIFRMQELREAERPVQDRPGLMHLAFTVDDIESSVRRVVEAGGETLGEVVHADVAGTGAVAFVYARDPEGNIVELQQFG
jgi:catechol 2,3-dioxygenase-like lactoylglutathione lyase family enzyme